MLEERIALLIEAIDALTRAVRTLDEHLPAGTGAMSNPQQSPLPLPLPADAPPPPMEEAKVITLADVRTALVNIDRDTSRAILRAAGVELLRDLPQAQYATVLAQAKEARGA